MINRSHRQGFTLLEVLLATLVAAIVLAAMTAAFYTALHLRNSTSAMVENTVPMNHAVAVLKADLRGALITGGSMAVSFESPGTEAVNNQPTQLDVFTTTGALRDQLPWGDLQKVSYLIKGQDLIRAVTRNLLAAVTPDLTEQHLLTGVSSLQFTFYDGANWQPVWDSTSAVTPVPQAIKVHIAFTKSNDESGRLPIEIVVPVVSQGGTNNVTGVTGI